MFGQEMELEQLEDPIPSMVSNFILVLYFVNYECMHCCGCIKLFSTTLLEIIYVNM